MDDTAAAGEGEGEDVLIVDDMCDGDEQIVLSYMDVDEEDCAHQAEDAAAEEVAEEEAAEELEPEVAEDATEEAADEAEEAAQEALADEAAEEAAEGAAEGAAGEGAPGEEEPAAECAEEGGAAAEDAPAGAPDVVVLDDDDEDVGSVEGGGGSPGGGGPVPVSATSALVEAAAPPAVGSGAEGAESPEGFVFVCNAENFGECQRHQLFGAAAWQLKKMKEHITPDTLLFLYNYSTERLYGTFVASGEADMNVVSGAFKGQFNAQVPASPLDDLILEASVPKRLQAGPKSAAEVASILEALQAGRRAAPEVQQAWGIEAPSAPAEEPPHKRRRISPALRVPQLTSRTVPGLDQTAKGSLGARPRAVRILPQSALCVVLSRDRGAGVHRFSGWNRISVERVVSGKGICNIYEYLAWKYPDKVDVDMHAEFLMNAGDAGVVAKHAAPGTLCRQALCIFAECYGAATGSMAIQDGFMPFRGLFITGGVSKKLEHLLKDGQGSFIKALHDKGRVSPLLDQVPLYLVKSDDMGQRGAHLRSVRLLQECLAGQQSRFDDSEHLDEALLVEPRSVMAYGSGAESASPSELLELVESFEKSRSP
ncbi:unnamed protein product, partial [Prorocentrum cordatum]